MRLQQADVQVNIRRHFRSHFERILCISIVGNFNPFTLQNGWTVFQGYQCTSSRSGRNDSSYRFTYFIRVFIQRESKHFNAAGVCLAWTSAPIRPVYINSSTGGIPTFLIFHINQVASPVRIIYPEFEGCLSACSLYIATGYGSDGATVDVCSEWFVPVFPPPAPGDAVNLIFQIGAVHYLSFCIYGDNVEYMILVCLDVFSFRLVQINTHIRWEWRERNALRVNTGISSRFEYTAG